MKRYAEKSDELATLAIEPRMSDILAVRLANR